MNKTKIEWADRTWNPVTGRRHGRPYCYARGIANRFGMKRAPRLGDPGMEGAGKLDGPEGLDTMLELAKPYRYNGMTRAYPMAFAPTFHRYRLEEPAKMKKPQTIFVVSMGDLFGDWVPTSWIKEVFDAGVGADAGEVVTECGRRARAYEKETTLHEALVQGAEGTGDR